MDNNKDIPGIDEDQLFSVTFTHVERDGVKCKLMSEETYENLIEELKRLRHFKDVHTGLWAMDKSPEDFLNKALYDGAERTIQTNTTSEDFLFDRIEDDIKEELTKQMFQIK